VHASTTSTTTRVTTRLTIVFFGGPHNNDDKKQGMSIFPLTQAGDMETAVAELRRAGLLEGVVEAEAGEVVHAHHAHLHTPTSSQVVLRHEATQTHPVALTSPVVTSAPSSPPSSAQAAEFEPTEPKTSAVAHEPSHVVHFDVRGR